MARNFFLVALGLFLLALAYTLGAHRAEAQGAGGAFSGITVESGWIFAITEGGDVYYQTPGAPNGVPFAFVFWGNILTGGPVPVESSSFGAIKGEFRGK